MSKNRYKRRKKIINKKFQLKTIFSVVTVSIVGFLIVIGLILIIFSISKSNIMFKTAHDLQNSITVQNNIVKSFLKYSKIVGDSDFGMAHEKILRDHNNSIDVIQGYIDLLKVYSERIVLLLIAVIIITLLQIIFLTIYIRRVTHRVAGPIYVMNRYLEDILKKKMPNIRNLRKNDEFADFYERFVELIEKIKFKKHE